MFYFCYLEPVLNISITQVVWSWHQTLLWITLSPLRSGCIWGISGVKAPVNFLSNGSVSHTSNLFCKLNWNQGVPFNIKLLPWNKTQLTLPYINDNFYIKQNYILLAIFNNIYHIVEFIIWFIIYIYIDQSTEKIIKKRSSFSRQCSSRVPIYKSPKTFHITTFLKLNKLDKNFSPWGWPSVNTL